MILMKRRRRGGSGVSFIWGSCASYLILIQPNSYYSLLPTYIINLSDRTPLEGNRLLIAQSWLQRARKRRVFSSAVSSIIEKRKEDFCSACSRTPGNDNLVAGLSWDGRYDSSAIDRLIKLFEDNYSMQESDNVWKAFFRENARYSTICYVCLDSLEQKNLHKDLRHVGASIIATRPGDISSDEEDDDDALFYGIEPVIVERSSDEGKMMSKVSRSFCTMVTDTPLRLRL